MTELEGEQFVANSIPAFFTAFVLHAAPLFAFDGSRFVKKVTRYIHGVFSLLS